VGGVFSYQITLQKFPTYTAKSGQSFGYAQNMRFKFALLGGKIAQNADGAKFTILNQTLLGKKKQVLEVISLRQHNGMDSFRHTLKRTLNSYVQDFSNATPLEL
jgi:hypothetical protein